jgi:hypothetical protein
MTAVWDGRPQNPERDSEGHVWRVDGDLDIFSWVAERQWYEDRRGKWATPADLIADNDVYYGQIITPAERNQLRTEVLLLEATGADAADEIDRLRASLHRISLGSQNSGTTKEDLGQYARAALKRDRE